MIDQRTILIKQFFQYLDSRCKYAILHHVSDVFITKDDLDFIVDCDFDSIKTMIFDFTHKYLAYVVNIYTIDINIFRFDVVFFDDLSKKWELLQLDCSTINNANDLLMLNSIELLKDRRHVNINGTSLYGTNIKQEIDYYIKKKAYKNQLITSYMPYLLELDNTLSEFEIEKKYQGYKAYYRSLRFHMKKIFNKLILILKRINEKPAMSIGFLGPDGAGKSTLINLVLETDFFRYKSFYYFKPIPPSNKIAGTGPKTTNPHHSKPYSKIKSYIKILYFMFQYNLTWIKNILPLKIKSSLIVFDRYYDDLLIDPVRYRYGGNKDVLKLVKRMIPKLDMFFILTTDAKIIFKRKQEVTFSELENQIQRYNELVDNKEYFHIDASKFPQDISNDVLKLVAQKMHKKLVEKYK